MADNVFEERARLRKVIAISGAIVRGNPTMTAAEIAGIVEGLTDSARRSIERTIGLPKCGAETWAMVTDVFCRQVSRPVARVA